MKKKFIWKWLVWLGWLLNAAVLHLFGNNAATLTILILSIVIPFLIAIPTLWLAGHIQVDLVVPSKGRLNEEMTGYIQVRRSRLFPVAKVSCTICCENKFTGECLETMLICKAKKSKASKIPFCFTTTHCGTIQVSVSELIAYDLFGLFIRTFPITTQSNIVIAPDVFSIDICLAEDSVIPSESTDYSMTKSGNDSSETYSIREYVPGDSIRSIHWKLSQKTDKLMVREYGLPISNQILLLLAPLQNVTAGQLHIMAEAFFSLSSALVQQGVSHTLAWRDSQANALVFSCIEGNEDLEVVLPLLLGSPVYACSEIALEEANSRLQAFSHVVVIGGGFQDNSNVEGRVTLLVPSSEIVGVPNGCYSVTFSENGYRQELNVLEI
ncbi:MAG: DUF58 domain-containing protein [Oscillospiraceae bacterium]|jgi:hypothetical protein